MTSEERRLARYERRKAKRNTYTQPTYNEVFTLTNLYKSYKLCVRGVGWKASIQRFKLCAFSELCKLYYQLHNYKWKSKGFYEFNIIERGKKRHIRSVHISERVVQRTLCDNALVPIFRRYLIYDNSATLKGKGIKFSHDRLKVHLLSHIKEYGYNGYILRYDVHDYFGSLSHEILFERANIIQDNSIKQLAFTLVNNFGDIGLGLGSQVSQINAVYYLTNMDNYIVHTLGIKRYARYMDDGYAICKNKEEALLVKDTIIKYSKLLNFTINEKKFTITKLYKGINWLKCFYWINNTGKVLRKPCRDCVKREHRKLKKFITISKELVEVSYNSWKSWLQNCNAWHIIYCMRKYKDKLITPYLS